MDLINNQYKLPYSPILLQLILTLLLLLFLSCEKEISLNFPEHTKMLVVEGWIEQDRPAKVLLTYSAGYFDDIDSTNLRNYVATRAKITVYYEDTSEILTLKPNDNFFPPLFYFGSSIIGKINSQYSIKIEDSGMIYMAKTTIPYLTIPDSVWFERNEPNDTLGLLWIEINDDFQRKNYYRSLVKRLGKDKNFVPTLTSAFNDKLFNGQKIRLSLARGSSNILEIGESKYFETGDILVLKFCSIDNEHFKFWHSIQNSIISSANPFSSSKSEIESNFDNALGIWGGYAAIYDTIIAK